MQLILKDRVVAAQRTHSTTAVGVGTAVGTRQKGHHQLQLVVVLAKQAGLRKLANFLREKNPFQPLMGVPGTLADISFLSTCNAMMTII